MEAKELAEQLKEKGVEARVGGGAKRFKIRTKTRIMSLIKAKDIDVEKLAAYLKKPVAVAAKPVKAPKAKKAAKPAAAKKK